MRGNKRQANPLDIPHANRDGGTLSSGSINPQDTSQGGTSGIRGWNGGGSRSRVSLSSALLDQHDSIQRPTTGIRRWREQIPQDEPWSPIKHHLRTRLHIDEPPRGDDGLRDGNRDQEEENSGSTKEKKELTVVRHSSEGYEDPQSLLAETMRLLRSEGIPNDAARTTRFFRWLQDVTAELQNTFPDHPLASGFEGVSYHLAGAFRVEASGVVSHHPGQAPASGSSSDVFGTRSYGISQNLGSGGNTSSTDQPILGGGRILIDPVPPLLNSSGSGDDLTIACPIKKFIFHHSDLGPEWSCGGLRAKYPHGIQRHLLSQHREVLNIRKDFQTLICHNCWGWYFNEVEKCLSHGDNLCSPVNLPTGKAGTQRRFESVYSKIFPDAVWIPSSFNEELWARRREAAAGSLLPPTRSNGASSSNERPEHEADDRSFLGHMLGKITEAQATYTSSATPEWRPQDAAALRLLDELLQTLRNTESDFFASLISVSDAILNVAAQEQNQRSQAANVQQAGSQSVDDSGYVTQTSFSGKSRDVRISESAGRCPSTGADLFLTSSPGGNTNSATPAAFLQHDLSGTQPISPYSTSAVVKPSDVLHRPAEDASYTPDHTSIGPKRS